MVQEYNIGLVVGRLDYLCSPDEPFYTMEGGEKLRDGSLTLPRHHYSKRVGRFVADLEASGLIRTEFDWPSWQHEALKYDDPATLKTADVGTCANLLTYHVRKDRFSDGHLGGVLESGHVAAVVCRLKEISEGQPNYSGTDS